MDIFEKFNGCDVVVGGIGSHWSLYTREDIKKKHNCRFGENGTIGGEGVSKIIEFSSFTNDEKHGRGVSE